MKRPLVVLVASLILAGTACGKPKPATPTPQVANADSAAAAAARAQQDSIAAAEARAREDADRLARQRTADSLAALGRSTEAVRGLLATMIHFDYDKANLRTEDASVLDQKISILQTNANVRVRVAGHCDERGSDEYNLALGNRRATSAKQYLVSHGIDAGRVETQSFGKERPLDSGHNEAAWSQNRRDEFAILSGGDVLRLP
jgi:peptidoglycan-associated lipoprotein